MYKHAVVTVDLSEDARKIIKKAKDFAKFETQISILNIVEPIALNLGGDIPLNVSELQNEQTQISKKFIEDIVKEINLDAKCYVIFGAPKQEIHNFVRQNKCDLIILGNYGRQGLSLLLGSTTQDVLQTPPCDVLSINLN